MITIDKLSAFGADTAEGLGRCYGNEALYLRLVNMVLNEKNFDRLKSSVDAGNLDEAFEAAHALKGVLGNLSLTPMYDKDVEITELLRKKTDVDYAPLVDELLAMKEQLCALAAD